MTELSINIVHYVNGPHLARYLSFLRLIFSLLICIACPITAPSLVTARLAWKGNSLWEINDEAK